jgi:RNA polymerase sigma factor (sigma-70 family)
VSRYSQEEIIDGLRRRDNRILKYIYKQHYAAILNLVLTNSGTEDDAKDIFQEALIIAFKNIREKKQFKLESNFQTYIYSISRLLWLKNLRNRSDENTLKENHPFIEFEEPKPFNEEDIRLSVYQKAFRKIPEDCQQILTLSNEGVSQKDIAEKLGFKSDNYIKKRKHYCKEYLISKIKEDPEFEED